VPVVWVSVVAMDNVTHTLVGAALAETGLKRLTPLATTALLLGANFPDLDIVIGYDKLAYLEHHRGITHALIAIPLLSLLLAGLIYAGSHWWQRRQPQHQRARFWPLFVLSFLAMSTHPLLDFTNSYGWRPFLPWNSQWYYGDIAFVVDPWLWVGLGGTLMLATATTRRRFVSWGVLFAVLALPIIFFGGISWALKISWLVMAGLFFSLRAYFSLPPDTTQLLLRGVLVAVLLYFGFLTWFHQMALAQAQMAAPGLIQAGEQLTQADVIPLPATPFLWRAVISTDQAFYFSTRNLFSSALPVVQRYERRSGEGVAILAALGEPEFQTFLRFARYPVIEAQRKPDQTTEVEIRDIRFSTNPRGTSTFQLSLRFDAQMHRLVE
jgi:inner membrane protein